MAEVIALAALMLERMGYSPAALESVQRLLFGSEAWPFWHGIVSLGMGIPLIMHFLFPRLPLEALIFVSCVDILIGGFFIR